MINMLFPLTVNQSFAVSYFPVNAPATTVAATIANNVEWVLWN